MASSIPLPTKVAGMLTSTEKSRKRSSPRRKICLPNRQRLQSPRFSPRNPLGKIPDCGQRKRLYRQDQTFRLLRFAVAWKTGWGYDSLAVTTMHQNSLLVEAAQVTARSIPEWRSKYFHLSVYKLTKQFTIRQRHNAESKRELTNVLQTCDNTGERTLLVCAAQQGTGRTRIKQPNQISQAESALT